MRMADKKSTTGATKSVKDAPEAAPAATKTEPAPADAPYKANAKPTLSNDQKSALGQRREKNAARPAFRRHEWWRYVNLGGKHAPWRVPSGIHSKVRRHFKYRPPVVSIGYGGPAAVRGRRNVGSPQSVIDHAARTLAPTRVASSPSRRFFRSA